MGEIDSLINKALRVYSDLSIRNNNESKREELSNLELKIQTLMRSKLIMPKSIRIHSKAKNSVSSEKLSYCLSNFPSHLISLESYTPSAFDMICMVSSFICCAQRFLRQRVLSVLNKESSKTALIHDYIMRNSSENFFQCERIGEEYIWNLYLPTVSLDRNWEVEQPSEDNVQSKFFIDPRLFVVSSYDEMKKISLRRNVGSQWTNNNYSVYFGDVLVKQIEMMKYLPLEDEIE